MREFTDADVDATVDIAALVDEIDRCISDLGAGRAAQTPKTTLPLGDDGFFLSVAGVVPRLGLATAKWASYAPGTSGTAGVSTSTITASDATSGRPLATISGMRATRLRTAGTAAVIVRRWFPTGAATLVLLGFGPTNRAVLEVLQRLGLPIGEVRVVVRSETSAEQIRAQSPQLVVTTDAVAAMRGATLAISATGSTTAVAAADDLAPGSLLVSLDGLRPWRGYERCRLADDRGTPGVMPFAAALQAGPAIGRAALFDIAGSAVTDVALAAQLVANGVQS